MRTSVLGRGRIEGCKGRASTEQPSGWSTAKAPDKTLKKGEIVKSCRDDSFHPFFLKVIEEINE